MKKGSQKMVDLKKIAVLPIQNNVDEVMHRSESTRCGTIRYSNVHTNTWIFIENHVIMIVVLWSCCCFDKHSPIIMLCKTLIDLMFSKKNHYLVFPWKNCFNP